MGEIPGRSDDLPLGVHDDGWRMGWGITKDEADNGVEKEVMRRRNSPRQQRRAMGRRTKWSGSSKLMSESLAGSVE